MKVVNLREREKAKELKREKVLEKISKLVQKDGKYLVKLNEIPKSRQFILVSRKDKKKKNWRRHKR